MCFVIFPVRLWIVPYSEKNWARYYHKCKLVFMSSTRYSCQIFAEVQLTYLLTPWCSVLLEQLTGLQLVKKFPAFHGTRRFITALTSVRQLPLSWASPIQSIYPQPACWRSVLILSTHLRLGLPSGLFPSGFPTKNLYAPLSSPRKLNLPTDFQKIFEY